MADELDSWNKRVSKSWNLSVVLYTILILLVPALTETIIATELLFSPTMVSPTIAFWKIGSVELKTN